MTIKEIIQLLDDALVEEHKKYIEKHKELKDYRGRELQKDEIEKVNDLLMEIQNIYMGIHPALIYISQRHQPTLQAMRSYEEFIASLKESGATEFTD